MMSIMKLVKNILFRLLFCLFCNQIFLFDLNPYENYYSSKPTGSVKETLEKISENSWKISSFGKHPLFTIKQESTFSLDNGIVVLESGFRKFDVLGGLRKDHQTYKVEKEGDRKVIIYSFGKKKGSIEIEENFYDNLTLQIQTKMNFLKEDQFKINYFDKGKIKIKSFLNKREEIIYKSKLVEVFEITEQREDKRYFKFMILNDSNKETIKVFQGGRGFNVDWELD
ncbi:hypothetical protein N9V05_00485 [Gammaproteobacteria bacterium]|nr:hypothetical protein [Gammaproteobacteria bacterium]